ncbi:WG repeat-containing protein [Psychrobacter sp. I-STPA10]|uniref:WG repeat-containing protein n=1 Tax=Psychrobacter sp. I-STPA10 TaxID=2585769 RepID=UPI001E45E7AA|nr:WG repeat-containing protein [Psychrobacter sp. I-STPA10]
MQDTLIKQTLIKQIQTNPKQQFKSSIGIVALCMMAMGFSLPAHACKIPKSYYKHVSCTASSRYFLAVKDSGAPVALLDRNGQKAVDLSRYTQVDSSKLRSGLLPVQRLGKLGYVNMQGREVIPAVYDILIDDANTTGWARAVSNERIVVKKNGKFGVINTSNKVIVPFSSRYQSISDFDQGVAQVRKSGKTAWIDIQGRAASNPNPPAPQPQFQTQSQPQSQSQSQRQPQSQSTQPSPAIDIPTPQATVSITSTTTVSSAGSRTDNQKTANTQVSRTQINDTRVWQPEKRDGKWGFVDHRGVAMITFSFDEVKPFSEGLAGVRIDNRWGFVNLAGELVIPFRFEQQGVITEGANASYQGQPAFVFTSGKAWIGNLQNGDKMCIDKDGKNVGCD